MMDGMGVSPQAGGPLGPGRPIGVRFDQVVAAAKAGGDWAWRELYRGYAPAVDRFLRARGVPDAEDLVGETFLRVVRHLDRFSGDEGDFRAWVFAIARNLVVDAARRNTRRPAEATPTGVLQSLAPAGDAEHEAMGTLGTAEAIRILSELTDDQRDVLLLRIIGDLSIAQVAEILGRREGAVKMLQARGLATLRRRGSGEAVTP
jgi:RNA polymerase sigma-70 factor (ECF subfamily)